ncbi:MAG: hypothetical protein AAB384_04480 [Patescibacteria group bacterium]
MDEREYDRVQYESELVELTAQSAPVVRRIPLLVLRRMWIVAVLCVLVFFVPVGMAHSKIAVNVAAVLVWVYAVARAVWLAKQIKRIDADNAAS